MEWRNEKKQRITYSDLIAVRQRLLAAAKRDAHAEDGIYRVRSLYFDTDENKALMEKTDGVDSREKYRIRYYNDDLSFLRLERKRRKKELIAKDTAILTREEAWSVLAGRTDWMAADPRELVRLLYYEMTVSGLRPRTVVSYIREPFVYAQGNVRVTFDTDVRAGIRVQDFLTPDGMTVPLPAPVILMEVKWERYLPDVIRDAVQIPGCGTDAFSKYAACRCFG